MRHRRRAQDPLVGPRTTLDLLAPVRLTGAARRIAFIGRAMQEDPPGSQPWAELAEQGQVTEVADREVALEAVASLLPGLRRHDAGREDDAIEGLGRQLALHPTGLGHQPQVGADEARAGHPRVTETPDRPPGLSLTTGPQRTP